MPIIEFIRSISDPYSFTFEQIQSLTEGGSYFLQSRDLCTKYGAPYDVNLLNTDCPAGTHQWTEEKKEVTVNVKDIGNVTFKFGFFYGFSMNQGFTTKNFFAVRHYTDDETWNKGIRNIDIRYRSGKDLVLGFDKMSARRHREVIAIDQNLFHKDILSARTEQFIKLVVYTRGLLGNLEKSGEYEDSGFSAFNKCDDGNSGEIKVPVFNPPNGNPLITSITIPPAYLSKISATEYHLFFVEQNSSGTYPVDFNSDLIKSSDGISWNTNAIQRNVISNSQSGKTFNYNASVIYHNNQYKVWHSATDDWNIAGTKLYHSTSTNGINYTGHGIVLTNEPYPGYDSRNISYPYVVFDGDKFLVYYTGAIGYQSGAPDNSLKQQIACATGADGINWTKRGVVLTLGTLGSFDSLYQYTPKVVYSNGKYEMFYVGNNGGTTSRIGYAVSSDGLSWEKKGIVDSIEPSVSLVGLTKENGKYRIWYSKQASNVNYFYLVEGY